MQKIILLQRAPVIDHITDDGHAMTQLPYPFYVTKDGSVGNQEFWKGDPLKVVGFQRDLAQHQIDVWWSEIVEDPQKAVGLYLVVVDGRGRMGVYETAIDSARVLG